METPIRPIRRYVAIALLASLSMAGLAPAQGLPPATRPATTQAAYNPLDVDLVLRIPTLDTVVRDAARQRDIPVLVYLPRAPGPAPVVLFSHGLGGSRQGCSYLGKHWAGRGYVAVFLQHPGSDNTVWEGVALGQRMDAMRKAAGGENYLLRVKDVPAVLDQLAKWNVERGHALSGRLDLKHIGMSGHSFGAVTTQAVSGQTTPLGRAPHLDARIQASVIFSPSAPEVQDPKTAFSRVAIPWLLMTGTKDVAPIGADVPARLAVFPALPAGNKYELVLEGGTHSAFTESMRGEKADRNPAHHRAIRALSTAFWDAYLKGDASARAWLDGDGPAKVLEEKDRWQKK